MGARAFRDTRYSPIHRAMPTSTTPCLSPANFFSGRVAHASPSITKGAMRMMERASYCQILGVENTAGRYSYCTLVRIGHIIRSRPIRMATRGSVSGENRSERRMGNLRIDTPSQDAPLNARWTSFSYKGRDQRNFPHCEAPGHSSTRTNRINPNQDSRNHCQQDPKSKILV